MSNAAEGHARFSSVIEPRVEIVECVPHVVDQEHATFLEERPAEGVEHERLRPGGGDAARLLDQYPTGAVACSS